MSMRGSPGLRATPVPQNPTVEQTTRSLTVSRLRSSPNKLGPQGAPRPPCVSISRSSEGTMKLLIAKWKSSWEHTEETSQQVISN